MSWYIRRMICWGKLDLTSEIPEDRGTHDFDSNRRVQLTKEMLTAYFTAVDDLLEFALPAEGRAGAGVGYEQAQG